MLPTKLWSNLKKCSLHFLSLRIADIFEPRLLSKTISFVEQHVRQNS
jgi:hypothetical protein